MNSEDFQTRLLETFQAEAREHIQEMTSGLLELEKGPDAGQQKRLLEEVFRHAHNLKGAARSVNLGQIESVCHELESVLARLKQHQLGLSPQLFDLLHKAVDLLRALLAGPQQNLSGEEIPPMVRALRGLIEAGVGASTSYEIPAAPPAQVQQKPGGPSAKEKAPPQETIRVSVPKLERILFQAEEMLAAELVQAQRLGELAEVGQRLGAWREQLANLGPEIRRLRRDVQLPTAEQDPGYAAVRRVLEHWGRTQHFLQQFERDLGLVTRVLEQNERQLKASLDLLLDSTKEILMLPFGALFQRLARMVRDLARDQHKEVDLAVRGAETEIDRRILEEMLDPFIHLIRNSLVHGIESPAERERQGKPPRGTISLSIGQRSAGSLSIVVADDGRGLDTERLKTRAVEAGLMTSGEAQALSHEKALALAFESGLSTTAQATDLSGRGLGLAIVREKVEALGGIISLSTHPQVGTEFRITLPVTLARFRGLLVGVENEAFVLPSTSVEQVIRRQGKEIQRVENREAIEFRGQSLALARLGAVLQLRSGPKPASADAPVPIVVLNSRQARIAFLVDRVSQEQEMMLKPLGPQLLRVRHFAGATVLGQGRLVPVLNVGDLFASALERPGAPALPAPGAPTQAPKKSILVAEDSITSRTLLKNILQAAGYEVNVAVDGLDAFTQLASKPVDLVVSDVDMPRMNGFELAAKIRGDKRHSRLPVILVTGLDSREDRARGIDVGANAYLVKSSFDQSNLLETIGRLL